MGPLITDVGWPQRSHTCKTMQVPVKSSVTVQKPVVRNTVPAREGAAQGSCTGYGTGLRAMTLGRG